MAEDTLYKTKIAIRERRTFDIVPETPWKTAVDKFLSWAKTNKKPGTHHMYRSCISTLSKTMKKHNLDEITPEIVEEYKVKRMRASTARGTTVTPATINREIATLKRLCSWATEQKPKLLDKSAIESVDLLKESEGRIRFLSEDEIHSLLEQCVAPHLRMAVVVALETGLRKHGALTLTWSEIVNDVIVKKVKGDKIVRIPVTETLREELSRYRANLTTISPYVIPSPENPRKAMRVDSDFGFDTAVKRAGIEDFRFHDLRHTFASHFLMRTKDIATLRDILGHSTIQMTLRYSHLLEEHKRKQMEEFDRKRRGGNV